MFLQYNYNFIRLDFSEQSAGVFTLFIMFQLFNAFNSRELGGQSIFKSINKNKIMVLTFACVLFLHVLIVQVFSNLFAIDKLSFLSWIKISIVAFSIIIVSEIYKFIYRLHKKKKAILIILGNT